MILQYARFRTTERFMVKTHIFIKGCSGEYAPAFSYKLHPCSALKNRCNEEHDLLRDPRRAGLEMLYATLLISTMEQPFSSIKALPKCVSNSS
jgi:hypothetical protein